MKLSGNDGLKNPGEMNPSSQNPIPIEEGQDRKCHCHNVPSCLWEKRWKRQLEEKLNTCKWCNVCDQRKRVSMINTMAKLNRINITIIINSY